MYWTTSAKAQETSTRVTVPKPWRYTATLFALVMMAAACGGTSTPASDGAADQTEDPAPASDGAAEEADDSSGSSLSGESITVIFPKHEADTGGAFQARVDQFQEDTGITVELIQSDWDSVADKVVPELATGGSAYDVVEFDNGWVAQWCGAGWVTPLDDFMPAGHTDGMIEGLVDLFTCPDGSTAGLVWNNDTRFMFYNADLLAQAGYDAPPASWDEFTEQSLSAVDSGLVEAGMVPFWEQEWALGNELHFWAYAFGGEIVDGGSCLVGQSDPKTVAALQFMMDSLGNGVAARSGLTFDQAAAQEAFLSGRSLFMPQGISGLTAYANDESVSAIAGNLGIGVVPSNGPSLTLPEAFAIPSNSEHKEAAWAFIEYMTSEDSNRFLAQEIGLLPIWTGLYTDPDLVAQYPEWESFSQQLTAVRGLSTLTWYGDWVDVSTAEVHKALGGDQSAQEALDAIASGLSEFDCTP